MHVGKNKNVGKDTIFYGTINIGFVAIFAIATINYYPMNDGLLAIVLTFRVIGRLFFVSVFATSIFVIYYHFYI